VVRRLFTARRPEHVVHDIGVVAVASLAALQSVPLECLRGRPAKAYILCQKYDPESSRCRKSRSPSLSDTTTLDHRPAHTAMI